IEDGHYLPVVRRRLQEECAARGLTDPPLAELAGLAERVAAELTAWAGSIDALGPVRVRNVRWPRSSLFIVDLALDRCCAGGTCLPAGPGSYLRDDRFRVLPGRRRVEDRGSTAAEDPPIGGAEAIPAGPRLGP